MIHYKFDSDFYNSTMTTQTKMSSSVREDYDGLEEQRLSNSSPRRRHRKRQDRTTDARSDVTAAMLVLVVILVCFCPEMTMSLSTTIKHRHRVNKNSRTITTMEMRMFEEGDSDNWGHDDFGDQDHFDTAGAEGGRCSSTTSTSPKSSHQSRRNFFHQFIASTSAAAVVLTSTAVEPEPANAASNGGGMFTYIPRPSQSYMPYEDFRTLLETDQLEKVEFGIDGRSLVCLDTSGKIHNLKDMPDDRPLLKELYEKGVTVTLQEMKYEKKMNTINWFRDLVGVGDDLTDEELYEYRGYKTYRQNIPERSYVPANLITGYDLSRNMRK